MSCSVRWSSGHGQSHRNTSGFGAFTACELKTSGPRSQIPIGELFGLRSRSPCGSRRCRLFTPMILLLGGIVGQAWTCGRGPVPRELLSTRLWLPLGQRHLEGPWLFSGLPCLVPGPRMKEEASGRDPMTPCKIDGISHCSWTFGANSVFPVLLVSPLVSMPSPGSGI